MTQREHPDQDGLRNMSRDSEDVARHYDDWADAYDQNLRDWGYEAPEQTAARLHDALGRTDVAVLDAGCGTGLSGEALAQEGFATIDGIDVSPRSVRIAERTGVYRETATVDLQKSGIPGADDRYDGLACVGVMTYLPDGDSTLREFARVLKPGGCMVLTQRSDLMEERGFRTMLQQLRGAGVFARFDVSGPMPYLPRNEEFGDQVHVHYITCHLP